MLDVAVIGGGAAGMAAALAAEKEGAKVLLIDKNASLGGILNQCIHNGFGLHYFGEELTGTEYADRFRKLLQKSRVEYRLGTTVLSISPNRSIAVISRKGQERIRAKSIVYTIGCRERSAGAIGLLGTRPEGVTTAGAAQKRVNNFGERIGERVVILGSGDIGLIMARRMAMEGAEVLKVLELMPYSTGLKRNIVQCLNDFNIPLEYSSTVTRVEGRRRLTGLWYARVDEKLRPIPESEQYLSCDTLLLSVGLIPEGELLAAMGAAMNPITGGALVDENRATTVPGVYTCGNALHVHDLVDNASVEGEIAGKNAARYALEGARAPQTPYAVTAGKGIRYALPNTVYAGEGKVTLYFRSDNVYRNACVRIFSGDTELKKIRRLILTPGEMETVEVDKGKISGDLRVEAEE